MIVRMIYLAITNKGVTSDIRSDDEIEENQANSKKTDKSSRDAEPKESKDKNKN